MNAHRRTHTRHDTESLLRWIFERNARTLTCELDVSGNRDYDVCVVPHWDVSSSHIEHFEAPAAAFLRHAEIARRLRADGWTVTDHVSATPVLTAA